MLIHEPCSNVTSGQELIVQCIQPEESRTLVLKEERMIKSKSCLGGTSQECSSLLQSPKFTRIAQLKRLVEPGVELGDSENSAADQGAGSASLRHPETNSLVPESFPSFDPPATLLNPPPPPTFLSRL